MRLNGDIFKVWIHMQWYEETARECMQQHLPLHRAGALQCMQWDGMKKHGLSVSVNVCMWIIIVMVWMWMSSTR